MVRPSMYTPAVRRATKVVTTTTRSPPAGFWFPGMPRKTRPSGKDSSMAIGYGQCLSSPSSPSPSPAPSGKDSSVQSLSEAEHIKAIGQGQCSPPPCPAIRGILKDPSFHRGGLSRVHFGASSVRTVSRWIVRKRDVFKHTPRRHRVQVSELAHTAQEIELPPLVDEPTQPECDNYSEPFDKSLEEVASQPKPTIRGVIGTLGLSFGFTYLLSKLL
ncbi:hypothetical protein N7493_006549 [Penicillium malachiteum]|uniref:Uncharacterized protein n=1 Tax=Penicillium malachiteum TaxID=1324776 RepID=A0AAD6HKU2_9EURO|nr:hypothetical protein N7493_006549 [Penicillium malachiteum]